jgi:hypothetical protein
LKKWKLLANAIDLQNLTNGLIQNHSRTEQSPFDFVRDHN